MRKPNCDARVHVTGDDPAVERFATDEYRAVALFVAQDCDEGALRILSRIVESRIVNRRQLRKAIDGRPHDAWLVIADQATADQELKDKESRLCTQGLSVK